MLSSHRSVVFGASGQIGQNMQKLLSGDGHVFLNSEDLNLTETDLIPSELDKISPQVIINCAAYTAVDNAETEYELANTINNSAVFEMAKWCAKNDALMVHYSTDYVFNGQGEVAWTESDKPDPINIYGKTKLDGESSIASAGAKALIFRTSWVYNELGKNFVNTMLGLARQRKELSIVDDQIGTPNYAYDLAVATLTAVEKQLEHRSETTLGVYHLTSNGYCSWYDFAEKAFSLAKEPLMVEKISRVSTEMFPTPAKRPKNSRMSSGKLKEHFEIEMPDWQDGLARCVEKIYEN